MAKGEFSFKLLAGTYYKGDNEVARKGETISSDERLDKLFKNKFKLLNPSTVKKEVREEAGEEVKEEVKEEEIPATSKRSKKAK